MIFFSYNINAILTRTAIDAKLDDLCNLSTQCIFRTVLQIRTVYLHRIWWDEIGALTVVATVALITLPSIDTCKIMFISRLLFLIYILINVAYRVEEHV